MIFVRLPRVSKLQPALGRTGATRRSWIGLSALASAWVGAVLVGGPIGLGAPTLEALVVGGAMAVIVGFLSRHAAPDGQATSARDNLLAQMPLIGVAVAMYASDQLVHLTTRSSALGWVLAATLPLLAAIAAARVGGSHRSVDLAFGCTAGVAAAALLHVAAADTATFDLRWALAGSIAGIALVGGISLAPPQPASRTPLGTTWRSAPFAAAWVMAIITVPPAAPRHELSTSAGAQVLAVTTVIGLLLAVLGFCYGERETTSRSAWAVFRYGMRRFAPRIATLALFVIGGLQAASYSEVTIDDLGQFWTAADALRTGREYPIGLHRAGLPGLPLFLIASFAVFGRTFPAALAPMFLANTLLPWLLFRACHAAGAGRTVAFAIAILAVVVPVTQIYSLGAADPEAVFIALLAAAVWALCHVFRTCRPRQSILVLGLLAGALAITRPEGPLYGGLLLLAALGTNRSRWAILGCCVGGVVAAPVVVLSLASLGRPWPTYSVDVSLANLVENARVVGDITAPMVARVLLLNDARFAMLIAAIITLSIIGSAYLTKKHWAFIVLPVAAAANVFVKLSISSYGVPLRSDFPPEFVRHISYPMPIFAVLTSIGVALLAMLIAARGKTAQRLGRFVGITAAVYLVAGSLYVLGTPEEFHHGNQSGSLLADSIYVNAPELWMNPFDLPGRGWIFFEYRDRLFAWYAPFDSHSDTAGMAYQTLTGAVAAMGFAALLVAAPNRRTYAFSGATKRKADEST